MRNLVVLGAGTAGTIAVNKLARKLPEHEWSITVVDPSDTHYYQPGFLFLPFGSYGPEQVQKPRKDFIPSRVKLARAAVERVDPEAKQVYLSGGATLAYDYLVIATGTSPRPEQTPGMADDMGGDVHMFYTFDGAMALRERLTRFDGGRFVFHLTELPIKCPVAPLEFQFLADAYFNDRGIRDDVQFTFVTPLEGAFTKPIASKFLGQMLGQRGIKVEPDFVIASVDPKDHKLISYDEREVPYDLLVTIPTNMGADFVGRSGLGDELNYVPVDKETLLSTQYDTIFAIGDASNIPASKAGSVAHYSLDLFPDNFVEHVNGRPMTKKFDGHANCFIESGHGKGLLIDFNYTTEPLPGKYPLPGIGPFSLLKETSANHMGKMSFRWLYWNLLIQGRPIPLPALMSMAGKHQPETVDA